MSDNNALYELTDAVINQTEHAVTGKTSEIRLILTAVLAGGNVLVEDVPGVGKTTLASSLAKAAGLKFRRIQFTPDVTASDITGFNMYNRTNGNFEFREGAVMCNLLLADEINRASPKTQSALLEAMEEKRVTVDGVTYALPEPFSVIATQNPAGFVGTYPLPEAQLDRFALKLPIGYPTADEELEIVMARLSGNPMTDISSVADTGTIIKIREAVSAVTVSREIGRYAVGLVTATRKSQELSLGASPRASIALVKCAQAYAFLHRRDFVTTDDIAAIFRPCITHRVVLRQDTRTVKRSASDIIGDIIRSAEVPYKADRK